MSKVMQNLVVLMEPSEDAWDTSLKAGNMILNRFCIDEDAAFELSGVNYLKKSSEKMAYGKYDNHDFKAEAKVKGGDFIDTSRFETIIHHFSKLYLHE